METGTSESASVSYSMLWGTASFFSPKEPNSNGAHSFKLRIVLTTSLSTRINTAYIEALSGLELAQANLEALRELVRDSATGALVSYASVLCRGEQGR